MSGGERVWDAVVVGGGPAGSALAARLAYRGHAVLLVDRAHFPRRKACGECVNPAGVEALERLGVLERVLAESPARLSGWRIHAGRRVHFDGRFPAGVHGLGVSREVLDAVLLDHARESGAEVRTGLRIVDLLREAEQVAGVRGVGPGGPEELRARLVVGADGLRSVVLRRLDLIRRPPRLRKVALTAHARGMPPLDGRGELHAANGGCLGVAEVGDGVANVTVVVSGERVRGIGGEKERCFDRALSAYGFPGARRVDEVLATGPFDFPTRRVVAGGALLVGDAAGYYDPFTGQGIFRALRGAELAAEVADAALRKGDLSARALAAYDEAHRRAFSPGRRLQRAVEAFVSRPPLLRAAVTRLARRPALGDALVQATGDVRSVRSLLRPSLLARLVL